MSDMTDWLDTGQPGSLDAARQARERRQTRMAPAEPAALPEPVQPGRAPAPAAPPDIDLYRVDDSPTPRQTSATSRAIDDAGMKRTPVDIRKLLADGLNTPQIIEGVLAQEDIDARWRDFVQSARELRVPDDTILAELTGANPDKLDAVMQYGGRGAGRGAASAAGAVAGAKLLAKAGTAVMPGKGTLAGGTIGAIGGGVLGYLGGDQLVRRLFGEADQFTPEALPYGIAAETAGEILAVAPAFARLPKATRAVEAAYKQAAQARAAAAGRPPAAEAIDMGKFAQVLTRMGRGMAERPAVAGALYGTEALAAGAGAGVAQELAPENPWVRFGAEMGAGLGITGIASVSGAALHQLYSQTGRFSPKQLADTANRSVLESVLQIRNPERYSKQALDALDPDERARVLTEGAQELAASIQARRAELEAAGVSPTAQVLVPELRVLQQTFFSGDPAGKAVAKKQQEEALSGMQTFIRNLFDGAEGDDAFAAAALARDRLNEIQIEELVAASMEPVSRLVARANDLTPTELAERVASLSRNRVEHALDVANRQGEHLYDQVDKTQSLFAPNVIRQYDELLNDPSLLPTEQVDRSVTDSASRAEQALNYLFEGDMPMLERWMDSPESTTVGELIALRRRMRQKAQSAGARDPNMARIYRSFEQAAGRDLQEQARITGWLEQGTGTPERVTEIGPQMQAIPGFRQGIPNIEKITDPALNAANAFWRAKSEVFQRQVAPRSIAGRTYDGGYRVSDDAIVRAFAGNLAEKREARAAELANVSAFFRNQQSMLDRLDVPGSPSIDMPREAQVFDDAMGEAYDLATRYLLRGMTDPATGTVDATKLQTFARNNPEFLSRVSPEIQELMVSAPRAQVAVDALRAADTPLKRAEALTQEFGPLLQAMVGPARFGGVALGRDAASDLRTTTSSLVEKVMSSQTAERDIRMLARFAKSPTDPPADMLARLEAAGIDLSSLDAERVQAGLRQAVGDYVFGSGDDFTDMLGRVNGPALRTLVDQGLLPADNARFIREIAEAGKAWQDVLEGGQLGTFATLEEAMAAGAIAEPLVRTMGSSMGAFIARKLGDPNSLIARSAVSRQVLNAFNNVPAVQLMNKTKQTLLSPDPDDFLELLRKQVKAPQEVEDVVTGLQAGMARFLFGPRPTTAQLRLIAGDAPELEREEAPPPPAMPPQAQAVPPQAVPPQAQAPQPPQAMPPQPPQPPQAQSTLTFDRYQQMMGGGGGQPGGAPGGQPTGGQPSGTTAAQAFPNDALLAMAGGQQPQGFAEGGLASLPLRGYTRR